MGVDWFQVSLRGYGGPTPTGTELFETLGLEPEAGFATSPSVSAWQAARIELVDVSLEELREYKEPTEEFAARLDRGFRKAAQWLASRPVAAFDRWRATGRQLDIFIGGWIHSDQLDLALPPEFLLVCGQLGWPIQICTND